MHRDNKLKIGALIKRQFASGNYYHAIIVDNDYNNTAHPSGIRQYSLMVTFCKIEKWTNAEYYEFGSRVFLDNEHIREVLSSPKK